MCGKDILSKEWTQGRLNAFIMSTLRAGSRRWPPKWDALEEAKTEKKPNAKTGRLAQHYKCAGCQEEFTSKDIEVDHIEPVVPLTGFVSWDNVIERLFCSKKNLQVLCTKCHKAKTKEENKQKKDNKNETRSTRAK